MSCWVQAARLLPLPRRRLRGESQRHHITGEQADYVHNEVRAALKLTAWLPAAGRAGRGHDAGGAGGQQRPDEGVGAR